MPTKKNSSRSKARSRRAPWNKSAPQGTKQTRLTKRQKAKARSAARRAGRPYPNLVDNMRVAEKARSGDGKGKGRGKKKRGK